MTQGIRLIGAPEVVLIDPELVDAEMASLLLALGLEVIQVDGHEPTVDAASVGIFGVDRPEVPGCYGWWVGEGPCPPWMHSIGRGRATEILSLLGTGFVQERVGAAFRAAGAGLQTPSEARYDSASILDGISMALDPPESAAVARGAPGLLELMATSLQVLSGCCAPNGAIAAAPPAASPGQPDYWFFWPRDGAHVAHALHLLGSPLVGGYVDFVAGLAEIGTSRYSMLGKPIVGYGNPQWDGPAATALVILTAVEDRDRALALARPLLDALVARSGPAYDLWELRVGRSFHELNLARRAFRKAGDDYREAELACVAELDRYRDPTGGFITDPSPQPGWFGSVSGLDMSIIGSALFCYDVTDDDFNVEDPDLAATMQRLSAHYLDRWPINHAWEGLGHGIGRFPEDCNDGIGSTGANPWVITTLWASQFCWRSIQRARFQGREEDPLALGLGAGFLDFVLAHIDSDALPEQINGVSGVAQGARPLAWSHAELVTTLLLRGELGL